MVFIVLRRGNVKVGSILPRKGEVAPKATEGEEIRQAWRFRPLRQATPATPPWRGGWRN